MNPARAFLQKYKSLSKPARASIWFTICYAIQRGLQFIGMPIYTRMMSSEEYGEYTVFLSWFNLINVFTSLGIYNGVFNKAMVKYECSRNRYISSIQYLTLITSGLFIILVIVFHSAIESFTGLNFRYQGLLCIHLMMFPTLQYWSQKLRFTFDYVKLVSITLANSALSLFLGGVFVFKSEDKGFALVFATVLVQSLISLILLFSLVKEGRCFYDKNYWKWTITAAVPLIPHYLSEILLGHADRLMIDHMCGTGKAGIYNIVYQISMVMTILRMGINGAFTPWLYYSLKARRIDAIRYVTKWITCLMWVLTAILMLIGPELLKFAAPITYYEAVVDIPAIMMGCFFIFIYVLIANIEIYFEQNHLAAIASVVAAALNVGLNYMCIPRFGYLAAGYTTMISYLIMAIMHYMFLTRIIKRNNDLEHIYDFTFILAASILLVLIGILAIVIRDHPLIRLGSIAAICGLFLKKKSTLIGAFRKLKDNNISR